MKKITVYEASKKSRNIAPVTVEEQRYKNPLLTLSLLTKHNLILTVSPLLDYVCYELNKEISSVAPKFNSQYSVTAGLEDVNYDILKDNISLFEHSLRCYKIATEITKEECPAEHFRASFMIAALGHDLGKNPLLKKNYKKTNVKHPRISADFIREFYSKIKFDQTTVDNAIRIIENHHSPISADPTVKFFQKRIDYKAREIETKLITEKQKALKSTDAEQ